MFSVELDCIDRNFCYNEYLKCISNLGLQPVNLKTYYYLMLAFDSAVKDNEE